MAELSLVASLVSLLDIGVRCGTAIGSLIREYRNAPDELIAASNEVSDFNVVLAEVEAACTSLNSSPTGPQTQTISALADQLRKAKAEWITLEALVRSMSTTLPSGAIKVERFSRLVKQGSVIKGKEALRQITHNINVLLESTSAYVSLFQCYYQYYVVLCAIDLLS